MSNLLDAINIRESRRQYIKFPIEREKVTALNNLIAEYNAKNDFRITLVTEDDDLFKSFISSYGILDGVRNYFTLVCRKSDHRSMEKLGYYGELLVLEATNMGLGTCWISGTYDKAKAKSKLTLLEDEDLMAIIAVGYAKEQKGLIEQVTKTITKRKTKDIKEMYLSNEIVPENFVNGMKAVQKAPSAMNKQPVMFTYFDGKATAKAEGTAYYNALDLGIAMCHFKIGANTPNEWEFVNNINTIVL